MCACRQVYKHNHNVKSNLKVVDGQLTLDAIGYSGMKDVYVYTGGFRQIPRHFLAFETFGLRASCVCLFVIRCAFAQCLVSRSSHPKAIFFGGEGFETVQGRKSEGPGHCGTQECVF